jgi:hypothetical protein
MNSDSAALDTLTYAKELLSRRSSGLVVPHRRVTESWQPRVHFCHQNAREYQRRHPATRVVQGWLYFDMSSLAIFGAGAHLDFLAHSILEDDGGLFDIAPRQLGQGSYPFLAHEGPSEFFDQLLAANVVRIRFKLNTAGKLVCAYLDK